MANYDLRFEPTELQWRYLRCPADDIHFGGAKGSGKSVTLAIEAYIEAIKTPRLRIALFRRSLSELRETLLKEAQNYYPVPAYKWSEARKIMYFKNGSTIHFCYCDSDRDLLQYQGQQFDFIGIDESGNFPEYYLNTLYACLRTDKENYRTKWRLMSNPIGIGKSYLVRRFITNKQPFKLYPTPETKHLDQKRYACFIQATATSNHHLIEKNPAYFEQLRTLPPEMQKALIDGDYSSRVGSIFDFDRDIHVDDYVPTPADQLVISMDWGTIHPFSFHWHAITPTNEIHTYREYYGNAGTSPDIGLNLTLEAATENFLKHCPPTEIYKYMVVDYAICERKGYEETLYDKLCHILSKRGISVIKCHKNRPQVIENMKSHLLINPQTLKPFWTIHSSCKYLIMQMNDLIYNKDGDDFEKGQTDHCADSAIYFYSTRPQPKPQPSSPAFTPNQWGYYIKKAQGGE